MPPEWQMGTQRLRHELVPNKVRVRPPVIANNGVLHSSEPESALPIRQRGRRLLVADGCVLVLRDPLLFFWGKIWPFREIRFCTHLYRNSFHLSGDPACQV
jgi:hypothetical protein